MSTPPSPPTPRKLTRSRSDKYLFGVCGGVARYLNLDPTLVRILTVALTLFTGVPVVLYLVAALVMPEETPASPLGCPPAAADRIWGPEGAPWEQHPPRRPAPSQPEAPVVPPPSEELR